MIVLKSETYESFFHRRTRVIIAEPASRENVSKAFSLLRGQSNKFLHYIDSLLDSASSLRRVGSIPS